MKLRHATILKCHPVLEIKPLGDYKNEDDVTPLIRVRFFKYDDEGMLKYEPFVQLENFSVGEENPENAKAMGESLIFAYKVALQPVEAYSETPQFNVLMDLFNAVVKVREENGC